MKKRILVLLMAGTLALSSSICAFAKTDDSIDLKELEGVEWDSEVKTETVPAIDVKWDDYKDQIKTDDMLKGGKFYEDEKVGVKYYLPENLEEIKLAKSAEKQGVLRVFNTSDGAQFNILEIKDDTIADAFDYRHKVIDELGEGCEPTILDVNGLQGVGFIGADAASDQDILSFAIVKPEEGKIIKFNFSPYNMDSKYFSEFRAILASMQELK